MSNKYEYLKKYINFQNFDGKRSYNWFEEITKEEIQRSEEILGFEFPKGLKEFWTLIGYGSLPNPHDLKDDFRAAHNNHVFRPKDIADILILKEESGLILPEAVEYMEEGYIGDGDILFFEIADMSSFLMMKSKSPKPNAVYNMIGEIIEEDFEKFIWRLYYESPTYYLDKK